MTSQTSKNRFGWRRTVTGAVASSAMAVGLLIGVGSATAHADALDDIAAKYDMGAGGGQVSNFVHEALQLRALGYRPSKGNMEDLQAGLDYLPNQVRLVEALKETVVYQRKIQAQGQAPSNPAVIGINQLPPGQEPDPTNPDNGGIFFNPGGGVTQPIAP